MAGERGPNPDGAVACLPERPVYGATGPGRGADPAFQGRRVRATPEPVWIVVRLEDHRLGPTHATQYIDSSLPEIRRHRYGATIVGDPDPVSHGVVRDLEERYAEVLDGAGVSRGYRVRAEGLADPRRGEDLDIAFARQSRDAAGVVGVSVGQQYGVYVAKVSADTGEEGAYAPWWEAGVDEEAAQVRLYVGRIARASARKYTQPQVRPYQVGRLISGNETRLDLSTPDSDSAVGARFKFGMATMFQHDSSQVLC